MIEINLIPDVKKELLKAQRARTIVISGAIITSIIAGGVVVLLLAYIYGFQGLREASLDGEIKDQAATLAEVEDLSKILTIQNQLTKIESLNEQKQIDSRIFNVISAVVPPEPNSVQISKVEIDAEASTIMLDGQTRAFDSMEVFKKTLDSAIVVYTEAGEEVSLPLSTNLDTGQVAYGVDANNQKVVLFSLSFEYPEELFSSSIASIDIKLSVDGNVTDSYLGIPRSIFTTPAVREGAN